MILPSSVATLLCLALGYLYPAYASFKTLDNKFDADQYHRWLAYWVVISAFSGFELIGDNLIYWFPFYYECKLAFISWLVLPYFKGSALIYKSYIAPLLEKYHPQIDEHVKFAKGKVQGVVDNAQKVGLEYLRTKGSDLMGLAAKTKDKAAESEEKTEPTATTEVPTETADAEKKD